MSTATSVPADGEDVRKPAPTPLPPKRILFSPPAQPTVPVQYLTQTAVLQTPTETEARQSAQITELQQTVNNQQSQLAGITDLLTSRQCREAAEVALGGLEQPGLRQVAPLLLERCT